MIVNNHPPPTLLLRNKQKNSTTLDTTNFFKYTKTNLYNNQISSTPIGTRR